MSRRQHPHVRRALAGLAVTATALVGATLGLLVGGTVERPLGPFDARMTLRPALTGDSVVELPPLGTLRLDTHDGPLRLVVQVTELDADAARRIADDPASLEGLGDRLVADLRSAAVRLAVRGILASLLGAVLLSLAVLHRTPRLALLSLAVAGAGTVGSAGAAAATARPDALAEPTYTGLLGSAPQLVGDVREVVDRFGAYRTQLARLVTNAGRLYAVGSTLPVYTPDRSTLRLLHVSDLHLNPAAFDLIGSVVKQYKIDAVLDTGDITDFGSEPETRYVAGIGRLGVPYVYVRGNHDSRRTQASVAAQRGAVVLDKNQVRTVAGVRVMGDGDPRFTPDKSTRQGSEEQAEVLAAEARATAAAAEQERPDLVLVHDPTAAAELRGQAPLALAGHKHRRSVTDQDGTTLMVQGSTGGAGLRGLEHEEPTPFSLTVLYLDAATRRLQAYDQISVSGLGGSSASIERKVVQPPRDEQPAQAE